MSPPRDTDRYPSPKVPKAPHSSIWLFVLLIGLAGGFSFLTAATVVWTARLLGPEDVLPPEIMLPLLLIAGLIALIVSLAILVAAFHLFELKDATKPFGVPEGTLQVVVALSLILIFAITSLYLRGSFDVEKITVPGLTAEQVDEIPGDEISEKKKVIEDDEQTTDVDESRFDIGRLVPVDEDAKDFSTQLLTILGTLVGAVAGFYFGAKSVETGVSAGGGTVPPTNTSPPVIGGNPRVGETLRAEPGGWTGSPAPAYGNQWQRKARDDPEWRDVKGATASNYLLTQEDREGMIRVGVTATNTAGSQTAYSLPTEKIAQAPTPTSPPTIEGEPREGAVLTVSRGGWTAWPEASYSYQWERSAPEGETWEPIPHARGSTYQLVRDDVGTRLRVEETATNDAGSSSQKSAPTEPISGTPVNTVPPSIPPDAREGETLTASPGAWTGWPLPFTYQWQRASRDVEDWQDVTDARESGYRLTSDDVGNRVRVAVSVEAVPASSAPTSVVKGAPTIKEAPTIEGAAKVGGTLTVEAVPASGWPAPTESYQWQRLPAGATEWVPTGVTLGTYEITDADVSAPLRVVHTASSPEGEDKKESEPTQPVEGTEQS